MFFLFFFGSNRNERLLNLFSDDFRLLSLLNHFVKGFVFFVFFTTKNNWDPNVFFSFLFFFILFSRKYSIF